MHELLQSEEEMVELGAELKVFVKIRMQVDMRMGMV